MRDHICGLEMTSQQYADIQQCEAVVIREYELTDGSRVAKPVAWGDVGEMRDAAGIRGLYIVRPGVKVVCQTMVLTTDLPSPGDVE